MGSLPTVIWSISAAERQADEKTGLLAVKNQIQQEVKKLKLLQFRSARVAELREQTPAKEKQCQKWEPRILPNDHRIPKNPRALGDVVGSSVSTQNLRAKVNIGHHPPDLANGVQVFHVLF